MKKQKRGRYGDGCIYDRGGIWWISWHEARRQNDGTIERQKCYASTHSNDKKFAQRQLRAKLQTLGGRRPSIVDPEKVSYEDLRQNFLAYYVANRRRSLKHARDGQPTLATLPRLDRAFGGWRACEISIAHLKRFRSEGIREGLSDARLNRYMATMRKMFNQALRDELITRAEVPAYFPTVGEPNEARGAVFIQRDWYEPLRRKLPEPLRSAFTLAYATGIRVHEMLQLRWEHVDLKKRTVELPGEITKTSKSRTIWLPKDFDLKPGKPEDLVFPVASYRYLWHDACVAIGAGYYQCSVDGCNARCKRRTCPTHGKRPARQLHYVGPLLRHCRHTAVRNMSDAGLEEKRIMEVSGHKTRSMFDRYNVGRDEDIARAGEVVERFHRGL